MPGASIARPDAPEPTLEQFGLDDTTYRMVLANDAQRRSDWTACLCVTGALSLFGLVGGVLLSVQLILMGLAFAFVFDTPRRRAARVLPVSGVRAYQRAQRHYMKDLRGGSAQGKG